MILERCTVLQVIHPVNNIEHDIKNITLNNINKHETRHKYEQHGRQMM